MIIPMTVICPHCVRSYQTYADPHNSAISHQRNSGYTGHYTIICPGGCGGVLPRKQADHESN